MDIDNEKSTEDSNGLHHNSEQITNGEDVHDARGMPTYHIFHHYNMNHKKRGLALIFNHEHFEIPGLPSRPGTNVDCNNLKDVLKGLGFQVKDFQNLVFKELAGYITNAANLDHSDHDCIMVCVLSHGELDMLYAKDTSYKPELLWHSFTADKCPTLAGKPKIFFIQACQGNQLDSGILMRTETDGPPVTSYIHTDFLIGYSTIPGYYSWRNNACGSWFIHALTEELREYGKTRDLLTLLTFVSQRVAYDFESNTPSRPVMHQTKQIPCVTSVLTRLIFFGDKK